MSTTLACASCRRSKMKCVGFDNPPCMRCAKVGRDCVPQQYTRNRPGLRALEKSPAPKPSSYRVNQILSPQGPHTWSPKSLNESGGAQSREESRDWLPNDSSLPSIYSTPPLMSVVDQTTPSDSTYSVGSKRRRSEPPTSDDALFRRDMIRLIEFASKRLLIYIPVLPPGEVDDPQQIIDQKKDLANCICFVAARFLPSGNAMREKLMPSISNLLHSKFPISRGGDPDELARLQALMVLYVYRPATTSPQFEDITHWRLKSIVEAYAIHLGCHRSINELRNLIRSRAPLITSSKSYKQYIMWLWLFTMSQHISLVTGSPPSIFEDATIRLAPETLKHIHKTQAVTRLLGEVELCMLWNKASIRDRGLAEWWCQVEMTDNDTSIAVLNDVDALLETWSSKWVPWISNDPGGSVLEFHLEFAKLLQFCMSTYSTRNFKLADSQLSPQHQMLVRRSVTAATTFVRLLTDMDPVTKDERVRYLADFGFVMISFCCQFIIRACEAFGSGLPDIMEHLVTVEEAAQLMKEVAIDANHSPALYSSLINRGLEKLRTAIVPAEDHFDTQSTAAPNTTFDSPSQWENELMLMDPLWEFSSFLGDPSFEQEI